MITMAMESIIRYNNSLFGFYRFFKMQPNPRGAIPGTLAKEFFEKSRLPIAELRKIWQLSDVTKDGTLSLEEVSCILAIGPCLNVSLYSS